MNTSPRHLLLAGAAAGPFFVVSSLLQASLRTGLDPRQQPPSALALGGAGWLQMLTFVVAGIGYTAGALGLHRTVTGGKGRWAPAWLFVFGLALIAGGIFRMDPAFGFPPGTPDGVGDTVSWHAAIHGFLFPLGFACILAAGWSLSRRYAADGSMVMRWVAIMIGPVTLALAVLPDIGGDPQGRFLSLWLSVVLAFGWVSLVLADVARPVSSVSTEPFTRSTA